MTAYVRDRNTGITKKYEDITFIEKFDQSIHFKCSIGEVWCFIILETIEFDIL